MKPPRPTFSSPEEVAAWIAAAVPEAGRILGGSWFCNPDFPEMAICLIDVDEGAVPTVSRQVDGQPFGTTSVTVTLTVTERFSCRGRTGGRPCHQRCSCSLESLPPH